MVKLVVNIDSHNPDRFNELPQDKVLELLVAEDFPDILNITFQASTDEADDYTVSIGISQLLKGVGDAVEEEFDRRSI